MTTTESGEIEWMQTQSAFGYNQGESASQVDDYGAHFSFGLGGHVEDTVAGETLVYMQQRYYDPELGRFLSVDPMGFYQENPQSFNRYAYGNNNPLKFVDPDGELPIFVIPLLYSAATFIAKEAVAEVASRATNGATDFLSARRMLKKLAVKRATQKFGRGSVKSATVPRQVDVPNSAPNVPNKGPGSGLTNQTRHQLLDSRTTFQDLIAEHQKKLSDYKSNPWAHDNQRLLRDAPSDAIREKIISGRIKVLERQLAKQQGELAKINKLLSE